MVAALFRTRRRRMAAWALAGVLALLVLAAALVHRLVPPGEQLAQRLADRATTALGVPVTVGSLEWQLRPTPRVVLTDVATQQAAPVRIHRVVAYLDWRAWLADRRLRIDRLEASGGTVSQASIREWVKRPAQARQAQQVVGHLVFDDITWVSRRGLALAWSGDVQFDAGWRPRTGRLWRTEAQPRTELHLEREATAEGAPDRWTVRVDAGGGHGTGWVTLDQAADGSLKLAGRLESQGIDTAGLLGAFKKRAAVLGAASATTTLSSQAASPGLLVRNLRTRNDFRIAPATLARFDLGRAVRTLGSETAGQTPLERLSGRLDTQNTAGGIVMRYSRIQAESGALTATGEATVFNRQVQGRVAVDLVDGVVGVPLQIGGTLDDPRLSVSKGAAAGAAVGTVLLPGVGTALGLRLGETLGKLFD